MKTTHSAFPIADCTLHRIEFDPASFHEQDLLWLPHSAQLANAGRKRKAEHLAGRIAAVHALRDYGSKAVPGIGAQRQPLWPEGLSGSISHCATTALAVVSRRPVGIDIETLFTPQTAAELQYSLIDSEEERLLRLSPLPFPLALTLAFSAKESLYKAFFGQTHPLIGFDSARIIALSQTQLTLQILSSFAPNIGNKTVNVQWLARQNAVITLCHDFPSGS